MNLSPNDRHFHPEPAPGGEGPGKQSALFLVRRDRKLRVWSLGALRMRF